MGNRAGEHGRDVPRAREQFDARTLGAVTDEKERRVLDAHEGVEQLVEGVEAAKTADPAHHEAAVEPERGARGARIGRNRERLEVDPGRRDDDRAGARSEPARLFRDELGPARDHVRLFQGR